MRQACWARRPRPSCATCQGQRAGGHATTSRCSTCTATPLQTASSALGMSSRTTMSPLTDGTGIVHNAPAFGEDDARVGRENDLPFVQLVDTQGEHVRRHALGRRVRQGRRPADPGGPARRAASSFARRPFTHSYPFCWRCDTPLHLLRARTAGSSR